MKRFQERAANGASASHMKSPLYAFVSKSTSTLFGANTSVLPKIEDLETLPTPHEQALSTPHSPSSLAAVMARRPYAPQQLQQQRRCVRRGGSAEAVGRSHTSKRLYHSTSLDLQKSTSNGTRSTSTNTSASTASPFTGEKNTGGQRPPSSSSPPFRRWQPPSQNAKKFLRQYSPLYRRFMGSSTRFPEVQLTRQAIADLERETLTHSPPSFLNDHLCIYMVKALRWLSDRLFRERYVHRATMLTTIASAPPTAAAAAAYLRMYSRSRRQLDQPPYIPHEASTAAAAAASSTTTGSTSSGVEGRFAATSTSSGPPFTTKKGSSTYTNSYAEELRGVLSQAESHSVHFYILLHLAEISSIERALVLLGQAVHFSIFFILFLVYPRMGFRLMGYLGEESAVVWTQMVNDIDLGKVAECKVPQLALTYWGLHEGFLAQEAPVPAIIPEPAGATTTTSTTTATKETGDKAKAAPEKEKKESKPVKEEKPQPRKAATAPAPAEEARAVDDRETLTLRDVILLLRSDERVFIELNHQTADALDAYRKAQGNVFFDSLLKKFK